MSFAELARRGADILEGGRDASDLLPLVAETAGLVCERRELGGVALDRGGGVVAGEILRGCAGKRAIELLAVREGRAVGVDVDAFPVASERHVRGVAVHHRVGEDLGPIHRGALAFVDGDRVTVGDVVVLVGAEGHPAAVVQARHEAVGRDLLKGRESAVLDADGLALAGLAVGMGDGRRGSGLAGGAAEVRSRVRLKRGVQLKVAADRCG